MVGSIRQPTGGSGCAAAAGRAERSTCPEWAVHYEGLEHAGIEGLQGLACQVLPGTHGGEGPPCAGLYVVDVMAVCVCWVVWLLMCVGSSPVTQSVQQQAPCMTHVSF
jgi:hypothetical protein